MAFLGGNMGVFLGGRHGWGVLGVPPKPQLALGTCENKGEAQPPLVLHVTLCESASPLDSPAGYVSIH